MSRTDGVKITETRESIFGPKHAEFFYMDSLRRDDGTYPSAIIVAVQRYGFKPVALMLPHQLYTDRAAELLAEHHGDELWVYPIYDSTLWTEVVVPTSVSTGGDS